MKTILLFLVLSIHAAVYTQENHLSTVTFKYAIKDVVYGPKGKHLLVLTRNNTLHVLDTENNKEMKSIVPTLWTYKASFSYNGEYLAFGNARKSIWIWDITSDQLFDSIVCNVLEPDAIDFSPIVPQMAFSERSGTLKVWDQQQKKIKFETECEPGCNSLTYSPDGNRIALTVGRNAMLWNFKTNKKLFLKGHDARVDAIVFSPDGKTVATCCRDKKIRFFNSSSGNLMQTIELDFPSETCLCNEKMQFSPDGKQFAYISPWSVIKIVNTSTLVVISEIDENQITTFSFHPDGNKLVYGRSDNSKNQFLLKTVAL